MYKKIIISTLVAFVFVGCGGGGNELATSANSSTTPSTKTSNSSYINPDDINLKEDINSGKVKGYDANGDRNSNYLAVLNYLRSLPIKCNDSMALEGPSPKLQWNELLKNSSYEHSKDMGIQEYFEHDGSGKDSDETAKANHLNRGSKFNERIEYNGYDYSASGENIAMYATKPDTPPSNSWIDAFDSLIKSRHGHCSNIMNSGFKDVGVAEYRPDKKDSRGYYRAYWTQDFGTHR